MMDKGMFENKRVFLTGHTGFKGAWLLTWLHQLGAEICAFALEANTTPSLYKIINGDKLCSSVIGDIRDKQKLTKTINDFQPDFVFHLAAQALVIESYRSPIDTFEVNTLGTANVLEALRFLNKNCTAVMITTDKVYHNNESGEAYSESDKLGGYDPYSGSKAAAEIVIDVYRKSFFNTENYGKTHQIGLASARAGNVIGGGDWAENRLLPDIVRHLSANEDVIIRNPNAVRPWQHVLEPLSGYIQLATFLQNNPQKFSQAYNFGPNLSDTLTVKEMADMALQIWGKGNIIMPQLQNQPHEANLLSLSAEKAKTELNWQAKWTAKEALTKTIQWYKQFYFERNDAKEMMLRQIGEYNGLMNNE
jgi:CDP-glucose 4,6-dehydratase